jgi:hypothetical protein
MYLTCDNFVTIAHLANIGSFNLKQEIAAYLKRHILLSSHKILTIYLLNFSLFFYKK